ncbi:MAG: hypothetical protein LBK25_08490 [Treponema sp.]|nr:hypothetical protein [Treponema sp.]
MFLNNKQVPLVYKRNRPVGVSGTSFRTTPVVKYSNTLWVLNRLACKRILRVF